MPTKEELEQRNAELEAEVAMLREELDRRGPQAGATPNMPERRFDMSEGVRQEIELAKADVAAGRARDVVVSDPGARVEYLISKSVDGVVVEKRPTGTGGGSAVSTDDIAPADFPAVRDQV